MTEQEHCRYLHIQDIRLYIQQEICNQESRRFLNANYGDSAIRVETVNEADTRACTRVICADKEVRARETESVLCYRDCTKKAGGKKAR